MPNTSSSKSNGAAKRMANLRRKARMTECWNRGKAKHRANAEANYLLHIERLANDGLGRRERRRRDAGLRGTEGGYGKDLTGVGSNDSN